MKLISEQIEDVEYITEAKESGEKNHFIQGVFLMGDIKNRNGRIYPGSILEKEVNRYTKEIIEQKRAYGELGHPAGPSINLDRVSHLITELKKDGSNYIGKAKLTNTPMGNIAKGLIESGAKLGVSSRGMGSLQETKMGMMVQEDYRIATAADIVADPSAPNAFVEGILENVEWIYDPVRNTWIEEHLDNTKKYLKSISISEINNKKMDIFEEFLASLTLKK